MKSIGFWRVSSCLARSAFIRQLGVLQPLLELSVEEVGPSGLSGGHGRSLELPVNGPEFGGLYPGTTLPLFFSPMTSLERILGEDGPRWDGRRPPGVPLVRVLSRDEAQRARPVRRGVVVSIRAPDMEQPELLTGWKAVLFLEIADVDVHGNLEPGVDVRLPAAAIAGFVRVHQRAPLILLHCHAGVSRSRSVAAAICEAFGWPYRWTVLHQPLYDAVLACLRDRLG